MLKSNIEFDSVKVLKGFELNRVFKDSHMIIFLYDMF